MLTMHSMKPIAVQIEEQNLRKGDYDKVVN